MSARPVRLLIMPLLVLGALLISSGCTRQSSNEAATVQSDTSAVAEQGTKPTVERAEEVGRIASEIEKEPARSSEILQQHGMTEEQFQQLLYDIAQDPALTDAYEKARTG